MTDFTYDAGLPSPNELRGIVPRVLEYLFTSIARSGRTQGCSCWSHALK
jgi:hypothetical protein